MRERVREKKKKNIVKIAVNENINSDYDKAKKLANFDNRNHT